MKLCICDLDGVVADATARFEQAKADAEAAFVDQAYEKREYDNVYWRAVFNPEYVPLDTLIDGTAEAINVIEDAGYSIYFLTSRPEHMREASLTWLRKHKVYIKQRGAIDKLIMKSPGFQYVKTVVWKAGMVQTLEALYGVSEVLVIDDEQANLNEIAKYVIVPPVVPEVLLVHTLAEAVAKLNGTWVEPDPFLPPEE